LNVLSANSDCHARRRRALKSRKGIHHIPEFSENNPMGALRARMSNKWAASLKNGEIMGALRARMVSTMFGASRNNARKNHSLKEEWANAAQYESANSNNNFIFQNH